MTKSNQEPQPELDRQTVYLSVRAASQKSGMFSEAAIRIQIFKADDNGLTQAKAIRRVAGRVLIHWENYMRWIDSQPSTPPVHNLIKARRGRKKANTKTYCPGKLVEVESGWPHVD